MKTWLIRRPAVRMPVSLRDHFGHQFVGMETALHQRIRLTGERTSLTAPSAAALLCGSIDNRQAGNIQIERGGCHPPRMRALGPTRIGWMILAAAASTAPVNELSSHGCAHRGPYRRQGMAAVISASYFSCLRGSSIRQVP